MATAELETMTADQPKAAETQSTKARVENDRDSSRRRPSLRNRTIFERRVLGGEALAALAKEYKVSHQRIAQVAGRVEGWIAEHPEDRLAERLRLRCRLRYEAIYDSAMTGFADSRKEEVTVKHRKTSRAAKGGEGEGAKPEVVTSVEERIVRQRHGDPRLLATAMKAVEKLDRLAARWASPVGHGRSSAAARRAEREKAQREREDAARAARIQAANRQRAEADAWLAAYDAKVKRPGEAGHVAGEVGRGQAAAGNEGSSGAISSSPAPESRPANPALPPGPIGWNKNGPLVLIASQRHVDRMKMAAERGLPGNRVIELRGEARVREWLQQPNAEAAIIWIEEELHLRDHRGVPLHGGPAAQELAQRGAKCPIAMGKNETSSERAMFQTLSDAGLRVETLPPGEEGWLDRSWAPMLRRLINGES